MEFKIIVPTYRRAGMVTTLDHVKGASLCVTASEEDTYRRHYPDAEIIVHPDTIVGLAPKRQWIYEKFGNVFMLDDDIKGVYRLYMRQLGPKLKPEETYHIIQWAGNMARLCGCFLFGFNKNPSPIIYSPFSPIRLSGVVTGCAFGMIEGSRLSFTSESTAVEDFYISGLNAHFHRKAFIDTRFNFVQDQTFTKKGGQSMYRNMETERRDTLFLRRCFGDAVTIKRSVQHAGHKKGVSARSKNPYGRTMTIQF
ncbi:MAG: hypothetical protein JXB23_14240 [Candidatus Aminicenantes bacterium]|nr:hypothetical protein [Candidatus Aminicenantes bacterium]